jgi:phosphate:Na+ symporter
MGLATDGLRAAAGNGLRRLLSRTGRHPLADILAGTALGTLVHSGPTLVMLIGFVNAGLMSLVEAIPAVLGANVGTTLSMQAVSLRAGDYCHVLIAADVMALYFKPGEVRAIRRNEEILDEVKDAIEDYL